MHRLAAGKARKRYRSLQQVKSCNQENQQRPHNRVRNSAAGQVKEWPLVSCHGSIGRVLDEIVRNIPQTLNSWRRLALFDNKGYVRVAEVLVDLRRRTESSRECREHALVNKRSTCSKC